MKLLEALKRLGEVTLEDVVTQRLLQSRMYSSRCIGPLLEADLFSFMRIPSAVDRQEFFNEHETEILQFEAEDRELVESYVFESRSWLDARVLIAIQKILMLIEYKLK